MIKIHIPTEQYGFIEVECNSLIEAKMYSDESKALWSQETPLGGALTVKEWNSTLDQYLTLNTIDSEIYEKLSPKQQGLIQEIKKSISRVLRNTI